ncbi:alcohol dehydrogenase catalytic domain-containing protein [Comamonas sediminis]|uniref:alcohol dehydrogenase catalytic domain-containing protein n=1 Tax=Comamonas sediminis TaxID=1783360 RepID=UPI003D275AD9
MMNTYRAVQASAPGVLELVYRPRPVPGPIEVLIEVEACGICGADSGDINSKRDVPRVPGHEVIGRITEVGTSVPTMWKVGMRVGVGRLGGHCNDCSVCRQGLFQLCPNQQFVGSSCDGGYAEMMLARSTGLVAIPAELSSVEAAPLLCAGLATFNAMRKSGALAGDVVAIQGIGGLGHLAVQYARKMGFRVIAVGRGRDIADDVSALGAHRYIDSNVEDPVKALLGLGGAQLILTTITDSDAVSALAPALAPKGKLLLVGVGKSPLAISPGLLVLGERSIEGSITGTPCDAERTLDFSVMANVRPSIETMPLSRAREAYERMTSGKAHFRMVITMGEREA